MWPRDLARELCDSFPTRGFRLARQPDGQSCFYYRDMLGPGGATGPPPAACWVDALTCLASDGYRKRVESLLAVKLNDALLSVGVCLYSQSFRLAPHTDQAIRIVTQTIYLNAGWQPEWGGSLLILGSSRMRDVRARYLPACNSSALFVRSEHSWHAVEPVRRGIEHDRKSILLHYSINSAHDSKTV